LFSFPDFVKGKKLPKPDFRSDLYSLGVVWYLCLTGFNPYLVERKTQETLKRHFNHNPLPPSSIRSEIPTYLDTIILKLLKENPNDRYGSAKEVIQDLRYLSLKPYSVIPGTARAFFLPEGEWIGRNEVLKSLQEKWKSRLCSKTPPPEVVWMTGKAGQGKSKALEQLKNYVQSHDGRLLLLSQNRQEAFEEWLQDVQQLTQDFSQKLVIAIDNFEPNHLARKTIADLISKAHYSMQWDKDLDIPWLFVFTANKKPDQPYPLKTTTLSLRNFNAAELKEFVKRLSPKKQATPPETFIETLQKHTDGNPLFVVSVLKALDEKGLLWNDDGAWNPNLFGEMGLSFARLAVPKDLKSVITQGWKNRSPKEKALLKWLSCFPNGFLEEGSQTMQRLMALDIFSLDGKRRLQFKNPFFQKEIYSYLTQTEKNKFHQKIALDLKNKKNHRTWWPIIFPKPPKTSVSALSSCEFGG